MYKTIEGKYGPVTFFLKDAYVGRSLYYYGEYGPDETDTVLSLAVPGKLCLDIGANIGCISQALVYNGFDVVAFEPQPEVYKVLKLNVPGFLCQNVALGAEEGTALMPKIHYSEKNNIGGLGIGMKSIYGQYEVPVRTLDSYGFENVGFIKIDVEGFEEQVLKGGIKTILTNMPILYIEDDRAEKSASLRKFVKELGYTIEEHDPPLYRPDNFFKHEKNIWDRYYVSKNIVCRPV